MISLCIHVTCDYSHMHIIRAIPQLTTSVIYHSIVISFMLIHPLWHFKSNVCWNSYQSPDKVAFMETLIHINSFFF